MSGPEEPGDDWAFPEVPGPASVHPSSEAADPASIALPVEESQQVYDTGSDAWWRQQAEAQRRAAPPAAEPPAPEPPAPEPPAAEQPATEGASPSPLDRDWLPPDLPELRSAAAPEPVLAVADPELQEELVTPEWYPPLGAETEPATVSLDDLFTEPRGEAEPAGQVPIAPVARQRPAVEDLPAPLHVPVTRAPHEGERITPVRAAAGALIAVVGVALGIGALLVYGHDDSKGNGPTIESRPAVSTGSATTAATGTPRPTPTRASAPGPSPTGVLVAPPSSASSAPAALAPVDVLNNSKITHLADRAARRFRAGGWTVDQTGNYRGGTIAKTTVYFAPGQQASAQRFAKQFGVPRVSPRFAGLPGSGLTVVLTRDFR